MEDWFHIKNSNLLERGGSTILSLYDNSIFKALARAYPHFDWEGNLELLKKDQLNKKKTKTENLSEDQNDKKNLRRRKITLLDKQQHNNT